MKKHLEFKLSIFFFIVISMFLHAFAQADEVKCHTPRKEKVFTVGDKHISFQEDHKPLAFNSQRMVSSTAAQVKTKSTLKGFTKTMVFEGQTHKIHIEDVKAFNEVNDYLSITSAKGHEMTYPIICEKVK